MALCRADPLDKGISDQVDKAAHPANPDLDLTADRQESPVRFGIDIEAQMAGQIEFGRMAVRQRVSLFAATAENVRLDRRHQHQRAAFHMDWWMVADDDLTIACQDIMEHCEWLPPQAETAPSLQLAEREGVGVDIQLIENMFVGHASCLAGISNA